MNLFLYQVDQLPADTFSALGAPRGTHSNCRLYAEPLECRFKDGWSPASSATVCMDKWQLVAEVTASHRSRVFIGEWKSGGMWFGDEDDAAASPTTSPAPAHPSPALAQSPAPTPSTSSGAANCEDGQVEALLDKFYLAVSSDNSQSACEARCKSTANCTNFDFTIIAKADACRLIGPNNPRLGSGGIDNRQYCTVGWTVLATDAYCNGVVLWHDKAPTIVLSNSQCRARCAADSSCNFYLWRYDVSAQASVRYTCAGFGTCPSTYPFADGDGGNIYTKDCCKTCKGGKACGDSCISIDKTCTKPKGCACDAKNKTATNDTAVPPRFVKGVKGTDACPSGHKKITDQATCAAGAAAVGWPYYDKTSDLTSETSVCYYCGGCGPQVHDNKTHDGGKSVRIDSTHESSATWICERGIDQEWITTTTAITVSSVTVAVSGIVLGVASAAASAPAAVSSVSAVAAVGGGVTPPGGMGSVLPLLIGQLHFVTMQVRHTRVGSYNIIDLKYEVFTL